MEVDWGVDIGSWLEAIAYYTYILQLIAIL